MTFKLPMAVLVSLSLAAAAQSGNLWPPRKYDQGVVAEWNAMLMSAAPQTAGNEVTRYFALMHIAMSDAISSIELKSPALHTRVPASRHASAEAAVATAAHDVLVALLPTGRADFDFELKERLATINPERGRLGAEVGRAVAQRTLAWAAKQRA